MRFLTALVLAIALPALAACTTTTAGHNAHAHVGDYPEATPFDQTANARADLGAAYLSMAANSVARDADGRDGNYMVLAVFGANWCHDSRALAGWLQTPRFQALIEDHYRVVYIEAGVPQTGEGRNLELAEELGVSDITGTPTVLVIAPDQTVLNTPEDARSWRNAASRSEDQIFAWLEGWTRQSAE